MKIANRAYVIPRAEVASDADLPDAIERAFESTAIRWYISKVTPEAITVEATEYESDGRAPDLPEPLPCSYGKSAVVSIIPTGVGCSIGGYAGDAGPATALLAACADYVITNPNAVNASDFILKHDHILYTEGYGIDLFCKGRVNLYRPYANRLGVLIEHAPPQSLEAVLNVVNVARGVRRRCCRCRDHRAAAGRALCPERRRRVHRAARPPRAAAGSLRAAD
jgi:hypothetical protein